MQRILLPAIAIVLAVAYFGHLSGSQVADLIATPTPALPRMPSPESVHVAPGTRSYYTLTLTNIHEPTILWGELHSGDVGFSLSDPQGRVLLQPGRVSGVYQFWFTAVSDGQYLLTFDNSFSIFTGKDVLIRWL